MKIRSILTCIMLSLPQYLIVKLLDVYIVFCKVVFYTHLLYLFVVANKYLLTYFDCRGSRAFKCPQNVINAFIFHMVECGT